MLIIFVSTKKCRQKNVTFHQEQLKKHSRIWGIAVTRQRGGQSLFISAKNILQILGLAGIHTGFFDGGRSSGFQIFCSPRPLLAYYAAMQYYFTSWKIAPGVHGVLDKIK